VLNRYRAAFEPSGSLSFSLFGLLGRLPSSMIGLALVLVVSAHGDYSRAGTLVGVLALAGCVGGPLQGRFADRFGQARALVPTALVFAVAVTALILGLRAGLATAPLAVLAAVVGASGPTTGTLARSRWSTLHPAGGRLQTAFAVESVFDEVVFVTGPVLVTVLAIYLDPLLPMVVAAVAGVAGSLLLAAQRRTEPPTAATGRPDAATPRAGLPYAALVPLLVVQVTIGTIFGSTDVVTVAAASAAGERGVAGLILACFSAGSLVSGLVVGALDWRMAPMRRVQVCVVVLGCSSLVLPFVPSVGLLPFAGFLVGATVSPALIAVSAAVQSVTPAARLTEAMAIATSALIAGFSLGSAVAGHLVDAVGPHRAYWQSAIAGILAALVVLAPVGVRRVARPADPALTDGVRTPGPARPRVGTAPGGRGPGGAPVTHRRPPARGQAAGARDGRRHSRTH